MLRFRLISLLIFTAFIAVGMVVIRKAGHGQTWIVWSAVMLCCAVLVGALYRPERDRNRNDEGTNSARRGSRKSHYLDYQYQTIGGSFGQCATSRKNHQSDLTKKVPPTKLRTGTRVAQ